MTDLPFYKPQGNEIDLFEHAYKHQLPMLIKGPTGCGKTRFINYMAARLGRSLYTVACHDDLTAADLVGRHLIGDSGTFWSDGPLTRAVREGAICYLVEARKDTTVVLHPHGADPPSAGGGHPGASRPHGRYSLSRPGRRWRPAGGMRD